MNAEQLRHILRAAAAVTGESVFVVIGSNDILGSDPDAPRSLRKSVEGDTYPKNHPEKAIEVDGAIGELSPFHQEFGYYAHGSAQKPPHFPTGGNNGWLSFKSMILPEHSAYVSKNTISRSASWLQVEKKTLRSFANYSNTGSLTGAKSSA